MRALECGFLLRKPNFQFENRNRSHRETQNEMRNEKFFFELKTQNKAKKIFSGMSLAFVCR